MAEIAHPLIDQTWRRIRATDSATAVAEAQRFAREQPDGSDPRSAAAVPVP
ncbi:MAG TPA: hypothetical protein VFF51_03255 [Candidatus Methylomirabilis sp.]|nr:hypothetical protein [Candidatus Methylomirabilis sp.]